MSRIITAMLLGIFLSGCNKPDSWKAFVYPDATNLSKYEIIGEFDNFGDCQGAAISSLRARGLALIGDFECGLNCKYDASYDMSICEQTRK